MRFTCAYISIILLLLVSCNQPGKKNQENQPASADTISNSIPQPDITGQPNDRKADSINLMRLSDSILLAIKQNDYASLVAFAHPDNGIRFSPYGYIDNNTSPRLLPGEIINLGVTNKKISWGAYDGVDSAIVLSIGQYFARFVYPHDFLRAPQRSINRFLGSGNSLNNLLLIFPGADFTEFYFPGFDPQYSGMDWQSLRLVFYREKGRYWLCGIVHDQWTI